MMRSVRDCSVCVVGGAGFLGSHLVNHLVVDRRCRVTVVDNLVTGRREFVHPDAEFVHADITGSEAFLRDTFASRGVRFVFNYAAEPYIPVSFRRPLHVFNTNAVGAIQVINASQEAGCEATLQVSSAELYGNATKPVASHQNNISWTGNISERYPVAPHSTYGAAKAAVDYYCQVAWRERGTGVIALRQFNCVGERETHPYVIPEIISQIQKWKDAVGAKSDCAVALGNNSSRDFLYAGDAVGAAVELLEKGEFGEVYNLGSEESVAVYDLARLVGRVMGVGSLTVVEEAARRRPWEIWHLCSDNSKINAVVGRRPLVGLGEAVRRAVGYYTESGCRWPWEV